MDEWTPEVVANRLENAAHTARRLPGGLRLGYLNLWPELLRMAPERMPTEPAGHTPPAAMDVAQMLEVMRWVQWLEIEHRHLLWLRADHHDWRYIGRRMGCSARTAQRRRRMALRILAERLNAAGN